MNEQEYEKFYKAMAFDGNHSVHTGMDTRPLKDFFRLQQSKFNTEMDVAITQTDKKVKGDCANLAFYLTKKLRGLYMLCSFPQGHSAVLHLDDKDGVVVTSPLVKPTELSKSKNGDGKGFCMPIMDFLKEYHAENHGEGYSVFSNEGITESNFTLREFIQHKRLSHTNLNVDNPQALEQQLEQIKQILLAQKNKEQNKTNFFPPQNEKPETPIQKEQQPTVSVNDFIKAMQSGDPKAIAEMRDRLK